MDPGVVSSLQDTEDSCLGSLPYQLELCPECVRLKKLNFLFDMAIGFPFFNLKGELRGSVTRS